MIDGKDLLVPVDLEHPHTVLIVDDQPFNLKVLSDYLVAHGLTVLIAEDGESGLERARYAQPDLIILDVILPGIDGIETCRQLKADARTRSIPVLFMTAAVTTADKVQGFVAGGVDYISKPIQHAELLARVTAHLRIQDQNQRLQQQAATLTEANRQLAQEIVERQRIETALRESEERFAAVMNSMQMLMYVADMETHELLFVNQHTRALYHAQEGQRCWEVIQAGTDGPCSFCTNARLMADGVPTGVYTWEFQNTRTGRWYYLQDQAIRWTDGRWVRLEIATDITELKQVQRDLEQAKVAAESANRAKSIFLANMSHDLRTPLNAILGFTQLMANASNLTSEQRANLDIVARSGAHLLAIINDVLAISKLESGGDVLPYADALDGAATPSVPVVVPTRGDLTAAFRQQPAEWQAEMQQAVTQGDMEWMMTLAEQIPAQDAQLAAYLLTWIEAFDYKRVLELTE